MIGWLNSWTSGIVIAIIIATIIEMILPEGKNKKYIKMVIGVYIIFTIVSPVIKAFTGKELLVDISSYASYFDTQQAETSTNFEETNNKSIEQIYISGLEKDITEKLKQKGYLVNTISIEIGKQEEDYGFIKSIDLNLTKQESKEANQTEIQNNIQIETIDITISNTDTKKATTDQNTLKKLTESEKKEIKEYLYSTYEVNKSNVSID